MMRFKKIRVDWWLIMPVLVLLTMGYIMIFSTTSFKGLSEYNDAYFFIKRHTFFLGVGLGLFFLGALLPLNKYKQLAPIGYLGSMVLVLVTLIPSIGISLGGASRWLNLLGFQFQPVEIVKFWWVIALSLVLSNKNIQFLNLKNSQKNTINGHGQTLWRHPFMQMIMRGLTPVLLIMIGPILLMMLQPDLGNAILTLAVGLCLLLVSSIPFSILFFSAISSVVMVGYSIFKYPYQMQRVQSFLNPWLDPLGKNYHIVQSFTAIGSGSIFGFGIGESRLKYFYLPLHYSDFIFSILCEEGGLFLAGIVIGAFGFLFARGMQIGFRQKRHSFEQFSALALTLFLVGQALINICVVIGLFPITGIPLTFISYGGSSLLLSMFCVGVLHQIGARS